MIETPIILLALLVLFLVVGSYASHGRCLDPEANRACWVATFACLILAVCARNVWIGALIALLPIQLRRAPNPRLEVDRTLLPILVWAGLYVVIAPHITADMVPVLLGAMLGIGVLEGLYGLYTLRQGPEPYHHTFDLIFWKFSLVEYGGYHHGATGFGNPNHAVAVSAITTAAGAGLVLLGYGWAAPSLLLSGLILAVILRKGHQAGQPSAAVAYLWTFAVSICAWFAGWVAWVIGAVFAFAFLAWVWRHHESWLSNRKMYWQWAYDIYKVMTWKARLFGAGLGVWIRLQTEGSPVKQPWNHLATNPHNEGVAMLMEGGWVGVAVLSGLVVSSFLALGQAGVLGFAVLMVGAQVLTCAGLSSPWHKYLQIGVLDQATGNTYPVGQGCTALNLLSFVTLLCVDAVLGG